MSEQALIQRKNASQLSTGPVSDEGKAASSRNAWKTGEHSVVVRGELWQELGMGVLIRPCKSTCPKYPCSLVDDGVTKPGGDCADKVVYMEAFDAIMDTLHNGDVANMHGLLASQAARAVDLLQQLYDSINHVGPLMAIPLRKKDGDVITDKDGNTMNTYVRNPLLTDIPKLMHELGINLPELMATPRAVEKANTDKETGSALAELMGRVGRVNQGTGPVHRHTLDVEPDDVRIEE